MFQFNLHQDDLFNISKGYVSAEDHVKVYTSMKNPCAIADGYHPIYLEIDMMVNGVNVSQNLFTVMEYDSLATPLGDYGPDEFHTMRLGTFMTELNNQFEQFIEDVGMANVCNTKEKYYYYSEYKNAFVAKLVIHVSENAFVAPEVLLDELRTDVENHTAQGIRNKHSNFVTFVVRDGQFYVAYPSMDGWMFQTLGRCTSMIDAKRIFMHRIASVQRPYPVCNWNNLQGYGRTIGRVITDPDTHVFAEHAYRYSPCSFHPDTAAESTERFKFSVPEVKY